MTTTATDDTRSGVFDLDLTIEVVCDQLHIDTTEVVGAPRITSTATLALATIAEISTRRGGMSTQRLAIELKLPKSKITSALEASDDGNLDTVSAYLEHGTAIHFLGTCLAELNRRMGYPEEPE